MAASNATVEKVYEVITRHVPDLEARWLLLCDLKQVTGNKSFEETVRRLVELHCERNSGRPV